MPAASAIDGANVVPPYLRRLGVAPDAVSTVERAALHRLQRAHVTTISFENLSIGGAPHGPHEGTGVSLAPDALYTKIVERERGGYCFELNGLFHDLLAALGFTVERRAARVWSALQTPANHHVNLVHLDRPYLVDVGTGPPMMRTPLPLDGTPRTDEAGVAWRVVESERPDAAYRAEQRPSGDATWTPRYVVGAAPRALSYFRAANDYLQSAPESPFTGTPTVARSTAAGYRTLTAETLTVHEDGDVRETPVPPADWPGVLRTHFGLVLPSS